MDSLAKSVNRQRDNIQVINYTVVIKVYRCVALISHLSKTLLIFLAPFQQMLFLLIVYQMQQTNTSLGSQKRLTTRPHN